VSWYNGFSPQERKRMPGRQALENSGQKLPKAADGPCMLCGESRNSSRTPRRGLFKTLCVDTASCVLAVSILSPHNAAQEICRARPVARVSRTCPSRRLRARSTRIRNETGIFCLQKGEGERKGVRASDSKKRSCFQIEGVVGAVNSRPSLCRARLS